jgi:HD-GYP domain-containing protein (c-di-GMP phosphodiesterase class II)
MLSPASELDSLERQCAPWDALEWLLQELNSCDRSVQHVRLMLEAVRRSVGAEVVYCCSDSPREDVEMAGEQTLCPQWCREFTCRLLAETPGVDGQMIRSNLPVSPSKIARSPRSAALVRLSRFHSSWIVALSFRADHQFDLADIKVMSLARRLLLHQRRQLDASAKLKDTISSLVGCMTRMIETRHPYQHRHSERVAELAARIGQQMRLPVEVVSDLYLAGLLHDVGTIYLPEGVFGKPDKLSEEELQRIKRCPLAADQILAGVRTLERLRPAIRHLRERYDGQGYPDGLAGENIPLAARILAVAESCDAMMSPRPYRPCLTAEHVEITLAGGAGKQWDPLVVEHFMACRGDLNRICKIESRAPAGPVVERAIGAWNVDSSQRAFQQRQQTVTAPCHETLVEHRK